MSKVALFTPTNRVRYSNAASYSFWGKNNLAVLDESSYSLAPDGTATAIKLMEDTSSAQHFLSAGIPGSGDLTGKQIWAELFWKANERPGVRLLIAEYSGRTLIDVVFSNANSWVVNAGFVQVSSAVQLGWNHFIGVSSHTFAPGVDSANWNCEYYAYIVDSSGATTYTGTSGSGIHIWHPYLSVVKAPNVANSDNVSYGDSIILDTDWDSTSGSEKYFDESKTPAGARTRYVYGQRERYRLNAEFLSTRDVDIINGWWRNGTPILMRDADDPFAAITSLFIADDSPPVAKLIKPYDDKWSISIDLEGY
jgi:hypothetical protein